MQSIQLTEPELAFVADLFSAYRRRRLTAIRKTGKSTASQAMEKQSLATIDQKLKAMHSQALGDAIVDGSPIELVQEPEFLEQIHP